MPSLQGKVAIVTASTDGIGFSIAKRLARDGAAVVVSSRKQARVDAAVREIEADGGKVIGLVCHVGNAEQRKRLLEETLSKFGGVDILVSNAAANPVAGPIFSTTELTWDKVFDINVKSTFLLCKEIVPHIASRGGGSIVLIGSIAGYRPRDMAGIYGASKTAMLGLTKAMVHQCAAMNIRVNNIAPGVIKTHFSTALWKDPEVEAKNKSVIPLDRIGEPDEIAGAVSFLVSEDASYITGETMIISGGITLARL